MEIKSVLMRRIFHLVLLFLPLFANGQAFWKEATLFPILDYDHDSGSVILKEANGEIYLIFTTNAGTNVHLRKCGVDGQFDHEVLFDPYRNGYIPDGLVVQDFTIDQNDVLHVTGKHRYGTAIIPEEPTNSPNARVGIDVQDAVEQGLSFSRRGDFIDVYDSTLNAEPELDKPHTLWVRYRTPEGEFESSTLEGDRLYIPDSSHTRIGDETSSEPYEITYALYGGVIIPRLAFSTLDADIDYTYASLYHIAAGGHELVLGYSDSPASSLHRSTSENSWTQSNPTALKYISEIHFQNDLFAATGSFLISGDEYYPYDDVDMGAVLFSPDGEEWTTQLIDGVSQINAIVWTGENWVAGANDGNVYRLDQEYWTPLSDSPLDASPVTALTFANGHLVAGFENGNVYSTDNFSDWRKQLALPRRIEGLANNATHFACLSDDYVLFSPFSAPGTPDFDTIPVDQYFLPSQSLELSASATGDAPISYQWYLGHSGDTSNPIEGATGTTLVTAPLTETTKFWVRASNSIGEDWSPTITATLLVAPTITSHPSNKTSTPPFSVNTSVTATGNDLSYQWYYGRSGDTSYPLNEEDRTLWVRHYNDTEALYWVRVYNDMGYADSRSALISFVSEVPTFIDQPVDQIAVVDSYKSIRASASGGDLDYQWYAGESGDTSSPEEDASQYLSRYWREPGVYKYWLRISNSKGSADSRTVTVRVLPISPPVISREPHDVTVYANDSFDLSITSSGTSRQYQWYFGESGDTSIPANSNSSYITVAPSFPGEYRYWVRVLNEGGYVDSDSALVTILQPQLLGITKQPLDATTYKRISTSVLPLSIETTSTAISHQWYSGNTGDRSNPISGATGSTYMPSISTTGTYSFWVEAITNSATLESRTAIVEVLPRPLVITQQPTDVWTLLNESQSLYIRAEGDDLDYQWYAGLSGDTSTPASGGTGSYFHPARNVPGIFNYWVRVSSGTDFLDSPTVTFTVISDPPYIRTQPADKILTESQTSSIYLYGDNSSALSYQWYEGLSGDTSIPLVDETSSTLSISDLDIGQHYFWCRVSNQYEHTDSAHSTVTILPDDYASWADNHGIAPNIELSGNSTSGDGVADIIKYAMGRDPHQPLDEPLYSYSILPARDGDFFMIEIDLIQNLEGINVYVDESYNMSDWDATAVEVGPRIDHKDGTQTRYYRQSQIGADSAFIRIRVEPEL